jgi:two-component system, NtrC family, nitrogen regulation sensor histidine kinase NtrY
VKAAGTLLLLALVGPIATAGAATAAAAFDLAPLAIAGASLTAAVLVTLAVMLPALRGPRRILSALEDGVRGFRDGDYSLRLAVEREDELGALVSVYNQIGETLRDERRDIFQRELLLDTLLHGVPVATLLVGPSGRVLFSNRAARHLLGHGRRLEGHRIAEILAAAPPELAAVLPMSPVAESDALFTVRIDGEDETFKAGRRSFQLGGQEHTLYLVERLTPELRRHEVEAWKNAVRIVNHELNNSLAPIRSLVNSARSVLDKPEHRHRLEDIFATVAERVTHLAAFLDGYAAFARLPAPRKRDVVWADLLDRVRQICPFEIEGPVPSAPACIDPSLMEQVLINLVKNARESGGPLDEVKVSVRLAADGGFVLTVVDRGRGMDEEVLRRALVPFYTSKPQGTGLGLPLSSEIVEAHGGRLQLDNRTGGGLAVTCRLPPR